MPERFDHWQVDDEDAGVTNPLSITMVQGHAVGAMAMEQHKLFVLQPKPTMGRIDIDPAGEPFEDGFLYDHGIVVKLTFVKAGTP